MNKKVCMLLLVLSLFFFAALSFAQAEEDRCSEQGIIVRNATMIDLWYTKNGRGCSIWIHEHLFTIKPEDGIDIFSDLNCQTLYCNNNPTYKAYKSVDSNGDCRVNIYPDCTLSDM